MQFASQWLFSLIGLRTEHACIEWKAEHDELSDAAHDLLGLFESESCELKLHPYVMSMIHYHKAGVLKVISRFLAVPKRFNARSL